jgi:fructose-bisphosphate aldolase class II
MTMPLVTTAELVGAGRPVAAFNVITLEHAEAIAAAAERTGRPAVLQISHNAVRYHGAALGPIAAATRAVAESSQAALALHLDHVEDFQLLHLAADAGFSSAMYDAGMLPYADNVTATRTAVEWAHDHGLWLEAELGYVGGKPDAPASAHQSGVRTDPAEAREFVAATGVDALAVAVGSSHAMTERTTVLDLGLIEQLRAALPVPLVLHGSSGVPDDQLRAAVAAGIVKVNIGTALNVAFTGRLRLALEATTSSDPRKYLAPARDAMSDVVADLLRVVTDGLS